jgi:Tfp pilus assembly protein PilN
LPARTRSVFSLLSDIEDLAPDQVWLSTILYRPRAAEVRLVAESESAEALTAFLLRLEKAARFSEVMLARQAHLGARERRTVQFEVRLKERL